MAYDPDTDSFEAEIVESTRPVVTAWDDSAPAPVSRTVSSWAVTPGTDDVTIDEADLVDFQLPADLERRMREDSRLTGEPVRETVRIRLDHDLDASATSVRRAASPRAAVEAAETADGSLAGVFSNPAPADLQGSVKAPALTERFGALAAAIKADQAQKSKASKRRAASRRDDLKDGGYKLPQIVIKQEPMHVKRTGRL